MRVALIPSAWLRKEADEHALLWGAIEPLLERACRYSDGRFDPENVRIGVVNGHLQLWAAFRGEEDVVAVMVTTLAHFPTGKKTADIVLLGGSDRDGWMSFLDVVEKWALKNECDTLTCMGRKGWARDLHDWKVVAWSFEKELR